MLQRKRRSLEAREHKVAVLENILQKAEAAFDNGNLVSYVDTTALTWYWAGLKDAYSPYFIVQMKVASRFPYKVEFKTTRQLTYRVCLNGNYVVQQANLVKAATASSEIQPELIVDTASIEPLDWSYLYFRCQVPLEAARTIKSLSETKTSGQWQLEWDWSLVANGRDIRLSGGEYRHFPPVL